MSSSTGPASRCLDADGSSAQPAAMITQAAMNTGPRIRRTAAGDNETRAIRQRRYARPVAWVSLGLGDHPERHAEAGPPLERWQERHLADWGITREPARPLVVERVELRWVAQRPVGPHDLLEGA